MKNRKSMLTILTLLIAVALVAVPLVAAAPPEPTYATANVDGNTSEWNLTNDFFADMHRAGKADKDVLGSAYLRYDTSTSTLYVLVLNNAGIIGIDSADDAFVKIDGSKMVDADYGDDGNAPDFAWVTSGGDIIGYEASFSLAPGEYTILIHLNVDDGVQTQAQTSSTLKTGTPLFVVPEYALGALAAMGASAAAFVVFKAKNKPLKLL
ncbi:MAG: hypothetical protein NWE92_11840 [Candidatus Bathyarchaeota archaeon]|nr:hypothetical protein [Candidatus Bathyarchaeota archaeon]